MALDKNTVLMFTSCDGKQLISSALPSISKLRDKGAVLNNVPAKGDIKTLAATGNESGETLWDATIKAGLVVGTLKEKFDLCVIDMPNDINAIEAELAQVFEVAEKNTLLVLVAPNAVFYYGTGIAKGKVITQEYCPCTVAATISYITNLPVPENCLAPVTYPALKDITLKTKEFSKLQQTITNMESAMERSSRQPWDKHDCA